MGQNNKIVLNIFIFVIVLVSVTGCFYNNNAVLKKSENQTASQLLAQKLKSEQENLQSQMLFVPQGNFYIPMNLRQRQFIGDLSMYQKMENALKSAMLATQQYPLHMQYKQTGFAVYDNWQKYSAGNQQIMTSKQNLKNNRGDNQQVFRIQLKVPYNGAYLHYLFILDRGYLVQMSYVKPSSDKEYFLILTNQNLNNKVVTNSYLSTNYVEQSYAQKNLEDITGYCPKNRYNNKMIHACGDIRIIW